MGQGEEDAEVRLGAWMAAAQRGDAVAYDLLLRELLPGLRAFVAMLVRDPDLGEDIVQSVLLNLHRARHTYRAERPFGPWLRAIARNATRDALRTRGRRARFEQASEEALAVAAGEAEEPLQDAEARRLLSELLSTLPAGQREALALLHLEALSVADAASRTGVSPGALKVRAHRGLRALRERFGGRGR